MSFDPERITLFALTDARGQKTPFGIKAKDRQRHMYVIGKTGMGKSTLLENMAAQDIQNGEGVAFIDPHGSAAEKLLNYVPEHRVNDVIYFAPFDLDNPISFNVMEDVGQDKRHLVVSGLMSTFKKIWVDAWSARMEYILTNALLALIEYPDTTLLSVNRLFSDKNFRTRVVDYVKDPAVKAFWVEEFANYTDRFAAEALPAIQNKVGQFTGNPLIRNVIGQPHSSFDIRKVMDEKKILIMNLSKGLVGETNASLLGSMLTTRIYLGAMSRADLPVSVMKTMPNFYFYVDEFQSFANATFANILSEARKYHLNLIIAHQYIEQMEEDVRNAVFGNVGTTISFRVGPFDAETLETVFTPRFVAADLVNLGFAQIYLTLMIDGIGSPPFSAETMGPIPEPRISCRNMVIAASRRNYTRPRSEVEKIIHDLHTPQDLPEGMKAMANPPSLTPVKKTYGPPKSGGGNARGDRPAPNNYQSREGRDTSDRRQDDARQSMPVRNVPASEQTTAPVILPPVVVDVVERPSIMPVADEPANEITTAPQQVSPRTESPRPSQIRGKAPVSGQYNQRDSRRENSDRIDRNARTVPTTPKKVEDLKSILSRIANAEKDQKPPVSKGDSAHVNGVQKNSSNPKGVADGGQLKAALANVLTPFESGKKAEQGEGVSLAEKSVNKKPVIQVQGVQSETNTVEKHHSVTPPKNFSPDVTRRDELSAMMAEAETAFAQLEATKIPAHTEQRTVEHTTAQSPQPDKKQIERMLRTSAEKSPFG